MSLQERLIQCRADRVALATNERELLDQIKAEEEKTYKTGDIFWRDEPSSYGSHYLQLRTGKEGRVVLANTISGTAVKKGVVPRDINAITMVEIQSMTSYSEGLRLVEKFRVTEK